MILLSAKMDVSLLQWRNGVGKSPVAPCSYGKLLHIEDITSAPHMHHIIHHHGKGLRDPYVLVGCGRIYPSILTYSNALPTLG